jgi:OmpA-OmpF porin, OOP family
MSFGRIVGLALVLCLIGSSSQAQMMSSGTYGPYLRLEGGWNHVNDLSIHGTSNPLAASSSEDEGFIAGYALGYGFGNLRAEFNFDYRGNSVDSIHVGNPGPFAGTAVGAGTASASGEVNSSSFMFNGYYDLPYDWGRFTPYIGAGVGIANMVLDDVKVGGASVSSDADVVAALQAMLGVRYALNDHWGLGLEYRFFNGFHPRFRDSTGHNFSTNDYQNHSILLSVSYSFGAPPPPPPAPMPAAAPPPPPPPQAAPMPGPRQLFIVFFDWDKASLTPDGRKVLDAAAAAFKSNRPIRIELTGYTDTSGPEKYNMALSRRRAVTVRNYLTRAGVPTKAMDVAWKGEHDLRVPTPDGVREPQNRRVEIIMP